MQKIYANNSHFILKRDGTLKIHPTPSFTYLDLLLVGDMALQHAREKKVKLPRMTNRWWEIPTLTEVVA